MNESRRFQQDFGPDRQILEVAAEIAGFMEVTIAGSDQQDGKGIRCPKCGEGGLRVVYLMTTDGPEPASGVRTS